jgi:NAD(P)H dehydrogenase (quinone)
MKHLIIYSHPNPKSFNYAIKETFANALKEKNHEVRVRDLYEINFDPVLKGSDFVALQKGSVAPDVKTEQDNIKWADVITFVYPIWWTGLPARIKGYIDRVMTFGFAYKIDAKGVTGLLSDKKVYLFNTTGTPEEHYKNIGMLKSMNQTSDMGIFEFCGMKVIGHKYFCGVPSSSDEARKKWLEEVKKIASDIK